VLSADSGEKQIAIPREPPCNCDGLAENRHNIFVRMLFVGRFEQHGLDISATDLLRTR